MFIPVESVFGSQEGILYIWGSSDFFPVRQETSCAPYSPPSPRLVCVETNPGPHRNRSRRNVKRTSDSSVIPRPIRLSDDTVYTFVQHVEALANCTSSTTLPTFTATPMSLSAFDQANQFAALFDSYRIEELEYRYVPRVAVSDGQFGNCGVFHSVIDKDDTTNLTTIPQALDYTTCKMWSPGQPNSNLVQRYKPAVLPAIWAGGAFSGYSVGSSLIWLDTNNPGIPYYGVKTAWTVTSSILIMDLYITARMQFKHVR